MTMLRETSPDAQSRRDGKNVRHPYRSQDELIMRDAVERWGRARYPDARCVHELVMDRGTVRADVAFITPDRIVVVEIKSLHDDTNRLLHQVGMFRLAAHEVWIAAPHRHVDDAKLIRYLMPSVGILLSDQDRTWGNLPKDISLDVVDDVAPFAPWPQATLALLWVSELLEEAKRANAYMSRGSKAPSHAVLVEAMSKIPVADQAAAVCRQLRARNADWRADPAIFTK